MIFRFSAMLLVCLLHAPLFAQTTNGPVLGGGLSQLDGALDRNYPHVGADAISGFCLQAGYSLGGAPEKAVSVRGEFLLKVRHHTQPFRNDDSEGERRTSISSVQLPVLVLFRVHKGLRLLAGPAVEVAFNGKAELEVDGGGSGGSNAFSQSFTDGLKTLGWTFVVGAEYRTRGALTIGVRTERVLTPVLKHVAGASSAHVADVALVLGIDVSHKREQAPSTP